MEAQNLVGIIQSPSKYDEQDSHDDNKGEDTDDDDDDDEIRRLRVKVIKYLIMIMLVKRYQIEIDRSMYVNRYVPY